jgi:hypothetical protein
MFRVAKSDSESDYPRIRGRGAFGRPPAQWETVRQEKCEKLPSMRNNKALGQVG